MATGLKKVGEIKLYIQDVEYTVKTDEVTPNTSLNSYIRDTLQLTGTKSLCYEGGCGSCVVVLYNVDPTTEKDIYLAVNSCLVPLLSCNGWRIYTIEGIGNPLSGYHPIQEVLAKYNGTQCGFCSPGMVMNMYALYESGKLTMEEVENSFGGNICRCTGYRPILSAFKSLCTDASSEILGKYPDIEDLRLCKDDKCGKKRITKCDREPFCLEFAESKWIKVYTLQDLLTIMNQSKDLTYKLVGGNTAKGVFKSYGTTVCVYIDVNSVPELKVQEVKDTTFVLGAGTSLTTAMELFNQVGDKNSQFSYLKQLANHIDLVANVPVRNVGTLAGNLMMKHDIHDFPSDVFLILETIGATFTVVGTDGKEVELTPHDFINYDMTLKVLKTITFPSYPDTVKYVSYKIMPRAQNSHAHVNAGFFFKFSTDSILESATIVYGNINPTFIHASESEKLLAGKNLFDNNTLQQVFATLSKELITDVIPPDPTPEFRKQLAIALFYKAVLTVAPPDKLSPKNVSGGPVLTRPVSSGTQDYETNESLYPLTEAVPKLEALAQTSGQAQYIHDMPEVPHQLHGTLILAEAPPNSTIKTIDASKALEVEGIVAFYSKNDIPGDNNFTPTDIFPAKEEIFCSGRVLYYEQPIGILVGTNTSVLKEAASLVEVTYDPPTVGPLLSVRQVLAAGRTDRIQEIKTITPTRKGDDVTHVVTGSFDIYHQYHFHMETQCCNVIPNENGLDVYPSSQWMDQIQSAIARMLQIQNNKINVTVRRLGGAFGAKISRNGLVSCAAALAAWKLRQPVKLSLSLQENMVAIGKRWPLSTDYEVGVNDQGVIQYLTCTHYSDLGAMVNEIGAEELLNLFTANYVNDTFAIHMDVVVTDTHTNTWARAPGSTEGLASIESIMEHVAYEIGVDPLDLRIANFPKDSQLLKYVNDLKTWADIEKRKQEIATFNQENRWKKKGLSVVPMAYFLDVGGPFSVMVSIFHGDGTVQISHGGIEVGQGINTKAAQVCAYKLGIPLEKVAVLPSNSFIAPNNTTTGGSVTSEAVCYGVIQACDQLLIRIQPYQDENPNGTWEDWIKACFNDYVNLSAIGLFSPNEPNVNTYLIYGVCATEVLVDVLTGQHIISRVDLIEDTGQSMSPAIDIGQVEGAFVMGMGYYTTEKIVYNYEGKILTNNTWTYYPPGPKDIPVDFRVKFPKDNPNPVGVLKSKATAEPPLCMTISVPLAIRNAVASARLDSGKATSKWFPFDGTTNVENVFMNSKNDYAQYIL
ncbi:xanthine dehydrogenase/oxidase [Tribolium castaneum]|uniref:Indole-3-acetaldehyde oxidase n=1 Tax=Tribolium castaneum TaxID=7070 RepID=D7EK62_TRICA|nr:PREDICTED: xanthine dehydrogenase/oxidase [Tribolium castaneum]XP_967707.1 PREDICTED: xanthine dehydrogenase/oxidase [Tribolium castaneum]EFA13013.1 Xanthine dehydrogenase-like Protein [Tribolium castaneum]|eukprot:XP_015839887.1 PREDICTED: xanthine dehydrogenase/oxidase [Tribolium castaneum]